MDDSNSEQQFRVFRDFDFLDVELEDGEVQYIFSETAFLLKQFAILSIKHSTLLVM